MIPYHEKCILYAVDGTAGIATMDEYTAILRSTGATESPEIHERENRPLISCFVSYCSSTPKH